MSKLIVGDVETNSINGGPLAGFRNAIINGNFDIWQRGTSFTGNQYGADRWANARNATASTQSRQAFALGQTDVPNEPEYFSRMVVSSVAGAGNLAALQQKIEGVRTFAGQAVTLSFWAKADASKSMAVEFAQNFGSGGSPSAEVNALGVTTLALTASWQKFTVTATLPSISGKTIGTNGDDILLLTMWFDSGSNYNARNNSLGQQSGTFDIAQVQLEAGSVATPFERRPVGAELALCQRYFRKQYVDQFSCVTYVPNGDTRMNPITVGAMRVTPTVSPATFTHHSINFSDNGTDINYPTITWGVTAIGGGENAIFLDFNYSSGSLDFGGSSPVVAIGSHCTTVFSLDAEL
jgi:hypothetical protein